MKLRLAVLVVLSNCYSSAKFQIFCINIFVDMSISISNFDLLIARFLWNIQKFNNYHNTAHFPSFPSVTTSLLWSQQKLLKKLSLTTPSHFFPSFSCAHFQADGLHMKNYVVSLLSFLVVSLWDRL